MEKSGVLRQNSGPSHANTLDRLALGAGAYGVRVVDGGSGSIVWDEVARLYGIGVSPFRVLSEELVKRAALRQGDRVVDIGVGNGWGLVPAARTVAPALAVGLDFSARMLAAAKERSDAAGLINVRLVQGDARHPGLADQVFDVALASSVFQFVGYAPDVLANPPGHTKRHCEGCSRRARAACNTSPPTLCEKLSSMDTSVTRTSVKSRRPCHLCQLARCCSWSCERASSVTSSLSGVSARARRIYRGEIR
jgi:hypothetical protein